MYTEQIKFFEINIPLFFIKDFGNVHNKKKYTAIASVDISGSIKFYRIFISLSVFTWSAIRDFRGDTTNAIC